MKECKNIFNENSSQKRAGIVILISEKIALKAKMDLRDKERE